MLEGKGGGVWKGFGEGKGWRQRGDVVLRLIRKSLNAEHEPSTSRKLLLGEIQWARQRSRQR